MSQWIVPVVVALIGGPLVILMQRFRKENKTDHRDVMSALEKIDKKVDVVGAKIDNHIQWHLGPVKIPSRKPKGNTKK